MTRADEIMPRIAEVIRRAFPAHAGAVARETTSHDGPGRDSVAHVGLMLDIEDAFGVELDPGRTFALRDVGDLADLVAEALMGAS